MRKKNNKRAPKRAPRRKAMRKRTNPSPFKQSQHRIVNSFRPKPQVFRKSALSANGQGGLLTGSGVAIQVVGGALASSMPDWSSITALYNRYKMLKITYTFNIQAAQGLGTLFNYDLPKMLVRYNYNSNLLATNAGTTLQEMANTHQFQFTPEKTSFSYSYYPRCVEPVYLSSVASGYKLAKQQYIDVQYGTVPHYGIAFFVDQLALGLVITYDISWEVAFKYQD